MNANDGFVRITGNNALLCQLAVFHDDVMCAKRDWLGKGINHDSIPQAAVDSFGTRWATTRGERASDDLQLPVCRLHDHYQADQ